MESKLWYTTPPSEWMEGLPIGNGRLAAMVWGDETSDVLSLNHEWLWRGNHRLRDNAPASAHLQEVRDLLRNGDFFHATALANLYYGGLGGTSGLPHRVDAYQPAGNMTLNIEGSPRFERRELDIVSAVAAAERSLPGTSVRSQFLVHPVYNLVLCHWASAEPFAASVRFAREQDDEADESCNYMPDGFRYDCAFRGGIRFAVRAGLKTDGLVRCSKDGMHINAATEILIAINIATEVKGVEEELARHPMPDIPWESLLASHRDAFSSVLGRLNLSVNLPENAEPTDRRIAALRAGADDPSLPLLFFHYGKYLLASSSICGELPANLQGKWNDSLHPPWECDYHFDINIQMNYWMAEACNMPECVEALLQYVERFVPHAKKAARDLYGCRGIWMPITSDAWGRATPEAYGWAVWIGAAAWMAQHFWRHYQYSGDHEFLRDRAFPFFREVAQFYEDYLTQDEQGVLQLAPSQSPENRFEGTGSFPVSIGISSAMDVQLCCDALGYAIEASRILGESTEEREMWVAMRAALPPFAIGTDGRLLEWDRERVEVEPGHRHLSHLYGLHPSGLFNPVDRPAQYEAAIRSLRHRLAQGGGHTGWSRAWVACLSARIGDSAALWEHITELIRDFATVSLLDLHPPRIFQIDGNLGAVEALLQGLVQCRAGKVWLLPALPAQWKDGCVEGIKTEGGHLIDMSWKAGQPEKLTIKLGYSKEIVLKDAASALTCEQAAVHDGDLVLTGDAGTVFVIENRNIKCGHLCSE